MAVDHEQRRRDIAGITIDLVAREGLAAATIRRIAAEAGFSTAAVTNYFADKEELLVWAFEALSREGEAQFEAVMGDGTMAALLTMVPWCPANVRRWKAYLAFWDEAARNAHLAELLAQSTRDGLTLLQSVLHAAGAGSDRILQGAELLNALIQGLALQILVDPAAWPLEKIRSTLDGALRQAMQDRQTADTSPQS